MGKSHKYVKVKCKNNAGESMAMEILAKYGRISMEDYFRYHSNHFDRFDINRDFDRGYGGYRPLDIPREKPLDIFRVRPLGIRRVRPGEIPRVRPREIPLIRRPLNDEQKNYVNQFILNDEEKNFAEFVAKIKDNFSISCQIPISITVRDSDGDDIIITDSHAYERWMKSYSALTFTVRPGYSERQQFGRGYSPPYGAGYSPPSGAGYSPPSRAGYSP
jgi:hypothetical protein